MKIKVCGLKHPENIAQLQHSGLDFMGFIFYSKSPRCIEMISAAIPLNIDKNIKTIGVFVNQPKADVLEMAGKFNLDFVQLHGSETVEYTRTLSEVNLKLIKAFQITDNFDWAEVNHYAPFVTYFLFDTATKNYGGSGQKFNWKYLEQYKNSTPFFLSGGISIDDAEEIKQLEIPQLFAIDINSKFETKPGCKNVDLVIKMIQKIKK